MPRKEFERDLVRINIRRKDHNGILTIKRDPQEPMYSLFQRIWSVYNTDRGVLENENEILKQTVQSWMTRALQAERQLERQSKLV